MPSPGRDASGWAGDSQPVAPWHAVVRGACLPALGIGAECRGKRVPPAPVAYSPPLPDTHSMTTMHPPIRRSLPWLLAGLSMIGPFSIDAVFPAFPLVGLAFGVDTVALQQLLSVYLVTYAAMSLFHGAISDAVGR